MRIPTSPLPWLLAAAVGLGWAATLAVGLPVAASPTASRASILDDTEFTADLPPALDRLYNLELDTADRRLGDLARRHPDHPVAPFLAALPLWWRVQIDSADESHDAELSRLTDETLARAERRLEERPDDPDGLFFAAAATALRGRLASLRDRWISAAYDGKKALSLVRRLAAEQPGNRDLLFGLGAYDYCAEAVPAEYAIFRPLVPFFPAGDRQRGLHRLETAKLHGRFARVEAAWLLAQLHYLFERDKAGALEQVHWLRARYPDNALFHAFEARVHARWGGCDAAEPLYRVILDKVEADRTGYNSLRALEAHYGLGRCAVEDERWAEALPHLAAAERGAVGDRPRSPFRSLTHLHWGMAADGLGDRAAAVRHYRRALSFPDAAKAHRRARKYLRRPAGR